jgi:hypothetical protein
MRQYQRHSLSLRRARQRTMPAAGLPQCRSATCVIMGLPARLLANGV